MKAIQCIAYGEPKDLVLAEIDEPFVQAGEVIVAVDAAGLGFVDALHVRGGYQVKKPLPFTPGSEIAGTVTAVGEGVSPALLGKRVMALSPRGGLAQMLAIPFSSCIALPDHFTAEAAASAPLNYCTGIYGLENCGALQPGETVLVLGASGGVGMAALDIAKGLGAKVVAAASSQNKLAACAARGADVTIDYSRPDWRKELNRMLGDSAVNVIYDPVGGDWSETAFRCLSPGGRHLVVGFVGGDIPRLPLNLPLLKRSSIVGVDWGGNARANPAAVRPILQRIIDLFLQGKINPQPSATYHLEEAPQVLERILRRENIGKPVIMMPM